MITRKRIGIFFANLFFANFIVFAAVGYWIKSMYTVGMGVEFPMVIPSAFLTIILLALLLTTITVLIGKK